MSELLDCCAIITWREICAFLLGMFVMNLFHVVREVYLGKFKPKDPT